MKEVHLSDGAMATMREDLAEAIDREPMVLCWAYVSKALDEIEWLREQWFELRCITKERDAALERVQLLRNWMAWSAGQHDGVAPDSVEDNELIQMAKAARESDRRDVSGLEAIIKRLPWRRGPGVAGHTCNSDAYYELINAVERKEGGA